MSKDKFNTWTGFANPKEAAAAGWNKADIRALVDAPRTKLANMGKSAAGRTTFIWPEVNGHTLRPFYSTLTADEKQMYRDMRKALKEEAPEAQGTRASGPKANTEVMQKWTRLLEAVKGDEEIEAMVRDLMPKQRNNMLFDLTGKESLLDIRGKVSYHYMMFRGPNGEFADDMALTVQGLMPLMEQGWTPKYTKKEVDERIEKLTAKGIDLRALVA